MIDPNHDSFRQREIGLEAAFFKERDQHLLDKLRGELSAMEERKKLAHVSGIVEERVLTSLVQAGVSAETLAAVSFIPMINVAWCDRAVTPKERDVVLNDASALGIHPSSATFEILKRWLDERPDPRLIEAWKEYVKEMARLMPTESLAAMKRLMLDRCARVSAATGGFLGLDTVSQHERAKIDEFAKAWDG